MTRREFLLSVAGAVAARGHADPPPREMSYETIYKLQPNRTMHLRGFDRRGAAAAFCEASASGFRVYGVFRDMADFAVLILYDADNQFEHPRLRYLPDFDFSGMVLSFDVALYGLQPLDSPKYPWIDWDALDVIRADGTTARIRLWDHAALVGGDFSVASGQITVQDNGIQSYDRLTLWLNNIAFDYQAPQFSTSCVQAMWWQGDPNYVHWVQIADATYSCVEDGLSSAQIAQNIAAQINANDPYCTASTGGQYGNEITITLRVGQDGPVNVSSSDGSASATLQRITAAMVAAALRDMINQANWPALAPAVAIMASGSGATITLSAARYGTVNVSGTAVTWVSGEKFTGIASGSAIYINGQPYTIASVDSPTSITLSSSAGSQAGVRYLAERGGYDGNMITLYAIWSSNRLRFDKSELQLSGGSSDATWRVSLDFSALGIDQIRQMWLTFAPRLANGARYEDTEWSATFSNWTVSDSQGKRALKVAGPGSVRVGSRDAWVRYSGSGWAEQDANNLYLGFARVTRTPGDSVTIRYYCQHAHDLWLGTSLYRDRGIVSVSVDGDTATQLDCYLDAEPAIVTRRRLRANVAPGQHTVTITLLSTKNAQSLDRWFVFDFLEAAVPSDVPDPPAVYTDISAALDYDTDHTYKLPPQRVVWNLERLGLHGQVSEYVGVFWWNQRKRVGGQWRTWTIQFGGTWSAGDELFVTIGGFTMGKSVFYADTVETIARHFRAFINHTLIGVWAQTTSTPGELLIHVRTPVWAYTKSISYNSSGGTVTESGDLSAGVEGTWVIDDAASGAINYPTRKWHADLYAELAARGWDAIAAFSMEMVDPPDDPPSAVYAARFYDGAPVETDVGFANLRSTHCAFTPAVAALQKAAYREIAGLMASAGLTPWLQFGEFVWWYFSSRAYSVVGVSGNEITVDRDHDLSVGDRIIVAGTRALDGTRTITAVTGARRFVVSGDVLGVWSGAGQVRGGSMAYYDAYTQQAAQSALGRPLARFTCQDDDPDVNNGADAEFLRARIKAHIDEIRGWVLSAYPNAKFELLWPRDVNDERCYHTLARPYPQGGRLNARVNLPAEYRQRAGSGIDRLRVEALSWGAFYRNLDRAVDAIEAPFTALNWTPADTAYLVPVFNGGCPWPREFLQARRRNYAQIHFWAFDHISMMGWPLPLPDEARDARLI